MNKSDYPHPYNWTNNLPEAESEWKVPTTEEFDIITKNLTMKTPIQELIAEFESIKEDSTTLKDKLYLDGVLSVIEEYIEKERKFAETCFDAGSAYGMSIEEGSWSDPSPDFDQFYSQYEKQ